MSRSGPAQLRARLGAAFAARLSPEHTRRPTLMERLTVQRLTWDVLVRVHRYLELTGKLATAVWVGFVGSVVLGVDWRPVAEDAFNSGRAIKEAFALAIVLPTLLFLAARSAARLRPLARAAGAVAPRRGAAGSPRAGEAEPPPGAGDSVVSLVNSGRSPT